MNTQPFCHGSITDAKVLVIGHDPSLQDSDTQAAYAFFADYRFCPMLTKKSEQAKYDFAAAAYNYAMHLTSGMFSVDQIIFTNLCNHSLPHAPKNKTVYIPETAAREGIAEIRELLRASEVRVIFAMSQQVNYWLQKLDFCTPVRSFLAAAAPTERGCLNQPPYYQPRSSGAFQLICGQVLQAEGKPLLPVLHVKNWPLKGAFLRTYGEAMDGCVGLVRELVTRS